MPRSEGDEIRISEVTRTSEGSPNSISAVQQGKSVIAGENNGNHKSGNNGGDSTGHWNCRGSDHDKKTEDEGRDNYGLDNINGYMICGGTDFVAVHGLHGNCNNSWRPRGEPETNMITEIAGHYVRILNYGYDALKIGNGIYFRDGIAKEASILLQQLAEARKGLTQDSFRTIVFIAHDIGGSIVKHALYQAGLESRYHDILSCTKLLILFGCPQRCLNLQDMEDQITRLVLCGAKMPLNNILHRISTLTGSVMDANHAFVESKNQLRAKVATVFSEDNDISTKVFDEYTVRTDVEHEIRVGITEPHIRLTCAPRDSNMWSILREFISSVMHNLYASRQFQDQLALIDDPLKATNPSHRAFKHAFLDLAVSLSPPFVPLARPCSSDEGLQWITSNGKFRAWRNNTQPDILLIDGAAATTGRVSECILQTVRQNSSRGSYEAYFSFDETDSRRNNAFSFLASVIAHWITHLGNDDATWTSEYSRFVHQRALTEWDLVSLLIKLRTFDAYGETVFVLDNVEQCQDLSLFWIHLARMFETSEHPVKFVLTTRSRDGLSDDWLMQWPFIHMDTEMDTPLDTDPIVMAMLETEIPQLLEMENGYSGWVEQLRTEIIQRSAQHVGLARFLLQQCRGAGAFSGMVSLPQLLSTPIEELLESTLDEIPKGKRPMVAAAITWVSYAFRPLSIQELISAITTNHFDKPEQLGEIQRPSEYVATSILTDLNQLLRGILDLQYEVRFQHPQLRDFFLKAKNKWYDVHRTAHRQIAETCLQYLASSQCHASLRRLCTVRHGILSTPTYKPKDDLAAYSAEHWVQHYSLSPESTELTALVTRFFQNQTALRAWEQARWFMTNPLTRTDRCYVSTLPLIASVGLRDLPASYGNDEPSRQALVEAARNGHSETVHQILDVIETDNATAEATLLAACSHGDEQLLISLINRFSSLPTLIFPPLLIDRASWLGQQQLVQLLVDRGSTFAATNDTSWETPLHHAARHGHTAIAKLLLSRSLFLVLTLAAGDAASPLMLAALYGHTAVVRLLLDHGTNKDACLATACLSGQHAIVRVLLDAGADPNFVDPTGRWPPPLEVAAGNGYERCVRMLLDHGADVDIGRIRGTALYRAAFGKHTAICRLLLEQGADANSPANAVNAAAGNNDLETVQLLVSHGADVSTPTNPNTYTALARALLDKEPCLELVAYLLSNGADPNDRSGPLHPLYHAILPASAPLVRLLLAHGADPNAPEVGDWTPLHAASRNATITRLLLDAGAAVERTTATGARDTALVHAVYHDCPAVIDVLLQHGGAQVDYRCSRPNDDERTALLEAAERGHVAAARALLEAGADVNFRSGRYAVVHAAAEEGGEAMLRALLEFGPDLAVQTAPWGDTALHRPALPLACARILVNAGVDVEGVNDRGWTPLCCAVAADNLDVARFLLGKKGARVDVATKKDGSPLHLACSRGSVEGVKMLVEEAGADVSRNYPDVGTPLYAACAREMATKAWLARLPRKEEDRRAWEIVEYLVRSDGGEEEEKKKKVDVNQPGSGHFGFALIAACAFCSVATVDALLRAGARVDVHDAFGRYPVHLAAFAGVANFKRICRTTSADLHCLDRSGRNVLHVAVQSGDAALVEQVLAMAPELLNSADCHGWTPLHYAARGSYAYPWRIWVEWSAKIIQMLLDRGADLWATTNGYGEQEWSPLKLARYHGAYHAALEMFTPVEKTGKDGKQWDEMEHQSLRANPTMKYCNCCLFNIQGLRYKCQRCEDFDLCYKCNRLAAMLHPGHKFEELGPEFEWEKSRSSDHDTSDEETDDEDESDEDDSEEESIEN